MRASGNWLRTALIAGVVKTTSPIWRKRTRRTFTQFPNSRFDLRLVDEHDRNVVLDRVDALTGAALQACTVLDHRNRGLAVWARQNFKQFRVDRHDPKYMSRARFLWNNLPV